MKKSFFSSLILLFLTFTITLSYQNCGEVGGTSPLSGLDPDGDDGDGEGGQQTGNQLRLQIVGNPSVQNRMLTVNFDCNHTPFSSLNHVVSIQVSGPSYTQSWTTYCSGPAFQINRTMNANYNSSNTYSITAVLTGIATNGEAVTGGAQATTVSSIGPGFIHPASTDVSTQNFSTLGGSGDSQDITVLGNVPDNYHRYTALRGRIEFTVASALPLNDGIYYGLFEFFPYRINNTIFSEYGMSVSRVQTGQANSELYRMAYYGLQGGAIQDVLVSSGAFQVGQIYVIDFVFRQDGSHSMVLYKKSNSGLTLYATGGVLSNFYPDTFGTEPMVIRLGKTTNSQAHFSGFNNVKFQYRACGYLNGNVDTNCSENPIPAN